MAGHCRDVNMIGLQKPQWHSMFSELFRLMNSQYHVHPCQAVLVP